ncbi:MAG: MFS transporter [Proteobacteria bacterium]|nr:MFS transporter [Pseudomonadota bacterium]
MNTQHEKETKRAYIAWLLITIFFGYQYILRSSPNVMYEVLRASFMFRAEEFATLGAIYLLAYALMQIPLGVLVDKIGVKKVVVSAILLCVLGAVLFATAQSFAALQLARLAIGIGSAPAFMCALKTIADHFPPGKRALLSGTTLMFGTAGALFSGKAILLFLREFDWREVTIVVALMGVVLCATVALLMREGARDKATLNHESAAGVGGTVLGVLRHRHIMLYAFLAVGLYTPLAAITDLWGAAFLTKRFLMSHEDAAGASLLMYLGLAMGSIVLPWWCEKYNRLDLGVIICTFAISILFAVLFYSNIENLSMVKLLLFSIGVLCGAEMMCFTGALLYSQRYNSGEIIGVVNTLNILGGAILQQVIGMLLDWQWTGAYDDKGVRYYSQEQFVNAMSIIAVLLVICCFASLFLLGGPHTRYRVKKV